MLDAAQESDPTSFLGASVETTGSLFPLKLPESSEILEGATHSGFFANGATVANRQGNLINNLPVEHCSHFVDPELVIGMAQILGFEVVISNGKAPRIFLPEDRAPILVANRVSHLEAAARELEEQIREFGGDAGKIHGEEHQNYCNEGISLLLQDLKRIKTDLYEAKKSGLCLADLRLIAQTPGTEFFEKVFEPLISSYLGENPLIAAYSKFDADAWMRYLANLLPTSEGTPPGFIAALTAPRYPTEDPDSEAMTALRELVFGIFADELSATSSSSNLLEDRLQIANNLSIVIRNTEHVSIVRCSDDSGWEILLDFSDPSSLESNLASITREVLPKAPKAHCHLLEQLLDRLEERGCFSGSWREIVPDPITSARCRDFFASLGGVHEDHEEFPMSKALRAKFAQILILGSVETGFAGKSREIAAAAQRIFSDEAWYGTADIRLTFPIADTIDKKSLQGLIRTSFESPFDIVADDEENNSFLITVAASQTKLLVDVLRDLKIAGYAPKVDFSQPLHFFEGHGSDDLPGQNGECDGHALQMKPYLDFTMRAPSGSDDIDDQQDRIGERLNLLRLLAQYFGRLADFDRKMLEIAMPSQS